MTSGPYLYDDGPFSPHTGTPRSRNGLIVAILAGTVALAVAAMVAFWLVKGSPSEQAERAAGVFLGALAAGDRQTAWELLCDKERARVPVEGMLGAYAIQGRGHVVGSKEVVDGGRAAQQVQVRWADGHTSGLLVVPENGPHICGATG
jgi:hypothetical protein